MKNNNTLPITILQLLQYTEHNVGKCVILCLKEKNINHNITDINGEMMKFKDVLLVHNFKKSSANYAFVDTVCAVDANGNAYNIRQSSLSKYLTITLN